MWYMYSDLLRAVLGSLECLASMAMTAMLAGGGGKSWLKQGEAWLYWGFFSGWLRLPKQCSQQLKQYWRTGPKHRQPSCEEGKVCACSDKVVTCRSVRVLDTETIRNAWIAKINLLSVERTINLNSEQLSHHAKTVRFQARPQIQK